MSTQLAPRPIDDQARDVGRIVAQARNYRIVDQMTRAGVVNQRAAITEAKKGIKAYLDFHVKPLKEQIDRIKLQVGPLDHALDEALDILNREILRDHHEQRRIADEQRRKAEEEARLAREAAEADARKKREQEAAALEARTRQEALAAGMSKTDARELGKLERADVETAPLNVAPTPAPAYVAPPPRQVRTEEAQVQVRKRWTYRLVDLEAVPRGFLKIELDSGAVRCAIRDGERNIPGLEIYQEDEVAGGRR